LIFGKLRSGPSRRSKLVVAGLVAAAACMQKGPVHMAPGGVLAPEGARGALPDDSKFRVVFSGPAGKAASASEVTIVFNRPLRALERDVPPPSVRMTPALAGNFIWVGSRAIRFVPAGPSTLPGATRVEVEVPETTRALDGSTLGAPHRFAFETPRPRLVSFSPTGGGQLPKATVDLYFNLPIEQAELEKQLVLEANRSGKTQRLAYRVERPDEKSPKRLRIVPKVPLPLDSSIEGVISENLRSPVGPLDASEEQAFSFSTYGPLRVTEATCWMPRKEACEFGSAPYFSFSNPVGWDKLKRAVSVTPNVKLDWQSWQGDEESTNNFVVPARFEPGRSYTVRVAGDLVDRHGQRLGTAFSRTFRFADHAPSVEIGLTGENLPPTSGSRVPVGAVNLAGYELLTAPLRPEDAFALDRSTTNEAIYDLVRKAPGSRQEHVASSGPKNRIVRREVDLSKLLPGGRGVAAIGVARDSARRADSHVALVKASDLGVTAKIGSEGSLVWVTRLSNAEPVRDAEVEILRQGGPGRRYRTDAHGLVAISGAEFPFVTDEHPEGQPALVIARSGGDWTYEAISRQLSPWRLSVPVDLSRQDREYGMIFTDRGVYRPGDSVRVKGIVRRETRTGNALVAGQAMAAVLTSPDGDVIDQRSVTTTSFGTFSFDTRVPASGGLGRYQLSLGTASIQGSFEVAEYRPAEFSVSVAPAARAYRRGENARFDVRGDYLFGAPMSGAKARYTLSRGPEAYQVPGHDAFVVGADALYESSVDESLKSGTIHSGEAALDALGRLVVNQALALPGQRGPERVLASVEVSDPARQVIAGEASALVHPADFYVGIEAPKEWFFTTPVGLVPRVLALAPGGERLAGKKVRLELVTRRWTLAREIAEDRDAHAVSQAVDRVVGSCEVVTAAEPRGCTLQAKEGGYYVVVARATDGRNNPVEAAIGLYGLGSASFGWGDRDDASVELVTNKAEYKVGETAKVLVKSPFQEAQALVTVERGGVYRSEHRKLTGSLPTLDIPITEDLRPNAYVAVHLVRARGKGKQEELVGAGYRMGYAELRVDPEARRLRVDVKASRREARPGEQVRVDLAVKDAGGVGRATELAVFAVDEGVLALTDYKTPDPVPVFTASRPLGIATLETREALARVGLAGLEGVLGLDKGRDGGGGGPESFRRDFRQTAFFEPAVVTDDKGRASVSFKLPDTLTTYRVMAVAVTKDDRYGFGADKVVVNKKLMARPALPRFLRAGDVVDAGIVVSKKGLGAGSVRVTAAVDGLVLEGAPTRDVDVGNDASVEVRFRLRAPRAGNAKLRFAITGSGQKDAVEVERRIQAPLALEAVALYGQTDDRSSEKLGALAGLDPDSGGLEVRLASTALVGLDTTMGELVDYPYLCTEQLSSRLLPLVPLRELAKDFGLPLPANADAVAERTIGQILERQRHDGGFALWPEARESQVWVSAYALWVLDEARRRGARVPAASLERGRAYLREKLATLMIDEPASAAFAVDVLATLGALDLGYAKRLLEHGEKLPLFAKGLLLHALAVGKAPAELRAPLARDVSNRLRIQGDSAYVAENVGSEFAPLMDSPTRTTAIVLRAILANDANHALVTPLVRGLLGARRGKGYRNTQENAFALLALDAYRRAREKKPPSFSATAWLGEQKLLEFSAQGRSTRAASTSFAMGELMTKANALLSFDKDGSGTVFYEARLRYAPSAPPKSAIDQGFFVTKTLNALRPEDLPTLAPGAPLRGATKFRAGDLVAVDLMVVTPSARRYVVVDDPLPAGFEPVDTKLRTTASAFSSPGSDGPPQCDECEDGGFGDARGEPAFGSGYSYAWSRQELRDDRALYFVDHMPGGIYHYRYFARATTAGRFVVPPTKAEGMYEPETFGRTAAGVVEVE
jgi:uncharacterized protein YfaS (alpha-2-macroglobulin family)